MLLRQPLGALRLARQVPALSAPLALARTPLAAVPATRLATTGLGAARFLSSSFGAASRPRAQNSSSPRPLASSVILQQTRARWSFAKYGFISSKFADRHPWVATLIRIFGSVILGIVLIVGGILLHDMCTYSDRHVDRVPSNPLSLHPRRGGPKNLPIIEANLDDEEDEIKKAIGDKPRLVIIGGGFGAVALIQSLPSDAYNVTVVCPTTYFSFTPLLPSACVGTVEVRSVVEPLRKIIARVHGHYVCGQAVDVALSERLLEVELPGESGPIRAYLPYDKLVVAVGSRSNDHGVKGLENCFQLKTIPDAQGVRRRIMDNLEAASLPTTTPEERKRLLSFVVCGGGPTGVEFAAELADMLNEDVAQYFPRILKDDIKVSIIQSRDHILNTYSEKISDYAEKHFARTKVHVIANARVQEVTPDRVILTQKDADGNNVLKEIDAGFVLWSTGIAMQPFTKRMVEQLPNQFHSKAVQVDAFLRVEGAPKGTVYCIGDASTIHLDMLNDLLKLWERFDTNKDNKLDAAEWHAMAKYIKKKYPLTSVNLQKVHDIFVEYDKDHDDALTLNEVAEMFQELGRKVTTLPATAQVASQQGKYIGGMLSKLAKAAPTLKANDLTDLDDEAYYDPFKYAHFGALAYIGNSAVFDYYGWSAAGGLVAMYAWRSVYWGEQSSMRTRFLLMLDWIKRGIFGRDLSRVSLMHTYRGGTVADVSSSKCRAC
ncbi:hypothetical protein VHUM_02987 [Vanrija humicola]|uniref:EF-hand domain-containing protein n=1 Tax=Vanrija humicola TaxID=5417 RepID=A0A7D8YYL0_VANHU|nr:hypothetical protein VHUM_02987 [Vanrija humicola]